MLGKSIFFFGITVHIISISAKPINVFNVSTFFFYNSLCALLAIHFICHHTGQVMFAIRFSLHALFGRQNLCKFQNDLKCEQSKNHITKSTVIRTSRQALHRIKDKVRINLADDCAAKVF